MCVMDSPAPRPPCGVADVCVVYMLADLHDQRLKKLRELTKTISEDDWMYPSADKLLGLK